MEIRNLLSNWLPQVAWNVSLWGNSLLDYATALAVFIVFLVGLKIAQAVILFALRPAAGKKDSAGNMFLTIVKGLRPPFYFFLALYFALQVVHFNSFAKKAVDALILIWVVYEVVHAFRAFIDFLIHRKFEDDRDGESRQTVGALMILAHISLWLIGTLFVLSNLGVQVNSLLAGLGIGGIAIAFAMQNILADIFSSFAIYFDKPFRVGDRIKIGDDEGVVERIGARTTRVRAGTGEEIVIANRELATVRIRNFGRKTT
jgi:small-conductance mechanosensitive channel